ncbi:GAF domain-containing protein [Candidatus Aerophobetes bacterium]|nr:GAF domain-containing protein [Candidatus Aerophobetes bacterium]
MVNVLFITHQEKRKEFLSHALGPEYFILTCDSEKKIDNLVRLVDLAIVDFSFLEWEGLNVVDRVKQCDDSTVILGVGRQVEKEIIEAARKRGLAEYIDVDKNINSLALVVREKMEKKMLITRMEEEKLSRDPSHSFLSPDKEATLSPEECRFLEEMSRLLIHGYNLDELMEFFLSLLNKMFGISRLCIILKDRVKKTYGIRACLGITEDAKECVELHPERGLVKFLAREGTVVTKERLAKADFKAAYEIRQDMKLIQSNVAVPLSPRGELIGILGLGPKITGDKMSRREIRQVFLFCNQVGLAIQNLLFYEEMYCQKRYIESVLKDATSGVISIDAEQKITTCNPRAQEVLNLGESPSLIGKDIRRLPSPLGDILFQTLTRGILYGRKEVYVPAIKRWLGISTSQVKNAKGEVSGSMMIFTDLTPIKHLEAEKEKIQKRDFLAQVAVRLSHELRNSLVPIKSLVELMPSKYSDEEFRKKLFSGVTKEIERIDNLIQRLVFFSQPVHLDKIAESLASLVAEAVERTKKERLRDEKIELNVSYKEDDLQVYVDKGAMIEALGHIVTNSMEAAPEEARIDIRCERTDKLPEALFLGNHKKTVSGEPTEYVKIEIRDNGPGLPGENADHSEIFDPFFTTKNRGVGLGLTISQSIIEEHGGSIVPLSEPGKGTAMVVYLPRYQSPF